MPNSVTLRTRANEDTQKIKSRTSPASGDTTTTVGETHVQAIRLDSGIVYFLVFLSTLVLVSELTFSVQGMLFHSY